MADDASQLWKLNDDDFLTHFNVTYPQHRSWQLYQPRPRIHSAVTYALHRKRSEQASFLDVPKQLKTIGSTGSTFANHSSWIHSSKTSKTPAQYSKSTSNAAATAPLRPVANLSELAQWRTRYGPLAKCSRHWGP
jgi:hypothetical protein